MDPATIAALLREISTYFELEGDRHRAGAYDRAAKSIEAANGFPKLVLEGRLRELPGVGPSIEKVVADLAQTGRSEVLERLRAKWPAVIVELSQLPAVGVVRAAKLHAAFAPSDLDAIAALARAGAIRELPGFGVLSEAKILRAIEDRHLAGARALHVDAEQHVLALAEFVRSAASRVDVAGPVRRWLEICDHLALAVASEHAEPVVERLRAYPLLTSVEQPSATLAIGKLADGLRCEVHIAPAARHGWTLVTATGSPEHVAALHDRARQRGVALDSGELRDEAAVYRALGLPVIPPELRDGAGELAAADRGDAFDDLVTLADVTTAFHCHTTYSDGKQSIEAMANAARELGMRGITITDHSAAASYAGGIGSDGLRAQADEIAALPDLGVKILRGIEADILIDGQLDVPHELLPHLDLVIASVHQRHKLDETAMTARIVTAMRQPHFKIWGHALGRLVMRRDPIAIRIGEVLDAIAESPAAIELNGDPYRLDLDPINARLAAARGIKFVVSSDAHSTKGLEAVRWAVAMARRARLRPRDVLNTLPPDELADHIAPHAVVTRTR